MDLRPGAFRICRTYRLYRGADPKNVVIILKFVFLVNYPSIAKLLGDAKGCPSGTVTCNDGNCCALSYPVCCNNGKCCQLQFPVCCPNGRICAINWDSCFKEKSPEKILGQF